MLKFIVVFRHLYVFACVYLRTCLWVCGVHDCNGENCKRRTEFNFPADYVYLPFRKGYLYMHGEATG